VQRAIFDIRMSQSEGQSFRRPKNVALAAKGRQNGVEIVEPHNAPGEVAPPRMLRQQ
jgi:hypothetical protein